MKNKTAAQAWDAMTDQQKKEWLAVNIFGWKLEGDEDHTRPFHVIEKRKRPGEATKLFLVDDWESKGPHPRLVSADERRHYLCPCSTNPDRDHVKLPDYLHDWNDTMEVVRAMCSRSLRYKFSEEMAKIVLMNWPGNVNANHFYDGVATGLCDSTQEAICKAAYLALQ